MFLSMHGLGRQHGLQAFAQQASPNAGASPSTSRNSKRNSNSNKAAGDTNSSSSNSSRANGTATVPTAVNNTGHRRPSSSSNSNHNNSSISNRSNASSSTGPWKLQGKPAPTAPRSGAAATRGGASPSRRFSGGSNSSNNSSSSNSSNSSTGEGKIRSPTNSHALLRPGQATPLRRTSSNNLTNKLLPSSQSYGRVTVPPPINPREAPPRRDSPAVAAAPAVVGLAGDDGSQMRASRDLRDEASTSLEMQQRRGAAPESPVVSCLSAAGGSLDVIPGGAAAAAEEDTPTAKGDSIPGNVPCSAASNEEAASSDTAKADAANREDQASSLDAIVRVGRRRSSSSSSRDSSHGSRDSSESNRETPTVTPTVRPQEEPALGRRTSSSSSSISGSSSSSSCSSYEGKTGSSSRHRTPRGGSLVAAMADYFMPCFTREQHQHHPGETVGAAASAAVATAAAVAAATARAAADVASAATLSAAALPEEIGETLSFAGCPSLRRLRRALWQQVSSTAISPWGHCGASLWSRIPYEAPCSLVSY